MSHGGRTGEHFHLKSLYGTRDEYGEDRDDPACPLIIHYTSLTANLNLPLLRQTQSSWTCQGRKLIDLETVVLSTHAGTSSFHGTAAAAPSSANVTT